MGVINIILFCGLVQRSPGIFSHFRLNKILKTFQNMYILEFCGVCLFFFFNSSHYGLLLFLSSPDSLSNIMVKRTFSPQLEKLGQNVRLILENDYNHNRRSIYALNALLLRSSDFSYLPYKRPFRGKTIIPTILDNFSADFFSSSALCFHS